MQVDTHIQMLHETYVQYAGQKEWNNLPTPIQICDTISSFNIQLKTQIYRRERITLYILFYLILR